MNIMIVSNSIFLPYTKVMLSTLFKTHPNDDMRVFLPYEDIAKEELEELSSFVSGYPGKKLFPLYVGEEFKSVVKSRNGINVETYYRILCMDMLPEDVDRILYLDSDMVIKEELNSLYNTNISDKAFAVCEDIFGILNGFHDANKYRMNIPDEYSYFNAGVMLYNMDFLRKDDACKKLLDNIYKDYERYEYNDQDVMNELYFDRLLFVGWDIYNCPPAWYYLNKKSLETGAVSFASYDTIKSFSEEGGASIDEYINVTSQIYESAHIIHYLADTKPWSKTRKEASVYEIFDKAFINAKASL